MNQIITYLPVLAIVMAINIALGMYYQIGKQNFKFDKAKFINGIIKAAILGLSAVGLAYCFEVVDLTSVGITPLLVIQTAIITYAGKDLINFGKILGVTVQTKSEPDMTKKMSADIEKILVNDLKKRGWYEMDH
ncbi:hypothetical protein [Robinsoniella peoriensis]|uniref:hypothetical protein n=1 Tax=Robinsoniella peoriensis TaxID=180332 RepID=UPI0006947D88|nr:hypothetical protein [Robinsoniella peoriensis]